MNDEQKAQVYGSLLNEHTKYFNEINRIKADNLDLNREQRLKIQELENKQLEVMEKVKKLFN
jgi:hypothetical protein